MCGITLEEFRLPTSHRCPCLAVFDVHAAPSSVQMTDLSETKVRLLVHETTPACMLKLHLYKFGASVWDVLFHFSGATPPTKSLEPTILGVSRGGWPLRSYTLAILM